jgi:LPXTG-motif cell wall-anchored protein
VEAPLMELSEEASALWAAAEGNPDTGDQNNNWYLYTLVISLLLGLGLMRYQSTVGMKK